MSDPAERTTRTARPLFWDLHAREVGGLPDTWRVFKWEAVGKPGGKGGAVLLTGAVATEVYKRGPRAGSTNWKKMDAATEQRLVITDADHSAWLRRWEFSTGECFNCAGNPHGQEWCGWSSTEGNSFRECSRCRGTGKPPTDDPEEAA